MEFNRHTLSNGLQIVAECNDRAHSASFGFFVQAGARDESDELAGVSHFLEHMVFKGTPRRSAEDVNREFDEMGAHYNAFTTEENTVYYAAVLPECQEPCIDLLADILRPTLRQEDFDTEKQVILEEIKMYDDQPPFGADDKCKATYFGNHPLARSVLGTAETITHLTAEQMRGYFSRRYGPSNITLAAAGRVEFPRLVSQAERLCGEWEPVNAGRDMPPAQPHAGFEVLHRENAAQQYVLQLGAGPSATDEDRFAAKLLATVLGDDTGSRLYWELIDTGLAEQASLSHYDYHGTGIMMAYMSCDANLVAKNLQAMHDIYRVAERDGITAKELAQAKSKLNSRIVLSSERPRSRLFSVGGNWTHRQEYRSVKHDLTAVEQVTLDEAHDVLARYPLTINTTTVIGPLREVQPPK